MLGLTGAFSRIRASVVYANRLLDRLRITTAAGVWDIIARYFPGQTITDRSRLLVEDLLNPQQ